MPLYNLSPYKPPLISNRHYLTVKTSLYRRVDGVKYQRERVFTKDDDFLDLDWSWIDDSKRVIIVLHGMEGDAGRHYVKGMIKKANAEGITGLGFNFRGCSGELNKQLRSYHSGETSDLHFVINYIIKKYKFEKIGLIGFSLGGNVVLKYIGERENLFPEVKIGVGISAPVDLFSTSVQLNKWYNKLYLNDFLKTLKKKALSKKRSFPEALDYNAIEKSNDFFTFDEVYTAPAHGFKGARDYWERSSSLQFLPKISIPTLLLTSEDDTFLEAPSYPNSIAQSNHNFYLNITKRGGHLGFLQRNKKELYSERIAFEFIKLFNF